MFKRQRIILLVLIFASISVSLAQQNQQSLSLEDCITKAMRNNLGVAVEVFNPEIADTSVLKAIEKFLPSLSFEYGIQRTKAPSFSWIDAAGSVNTQYDNYSAQITQSLPTGGEFAVTLEGYKTESNRKFLTINPRYGSQLLFLFSQPLLKDFGFKISRKEIIVAKYNREISENQLITVLLDTVYNVEEAYWNLVFNVENLRVIKQSLKLAQDLLVKNKREVEVGTLAPIEILTAQAEVATREADILQAEALVRNSEDLLKTIINLDREGKAAEVNIVPSDSPVYEKKDVSLEESLMVAIEKRPDLASSRIDLKNKDIELTYAKNQLLPDLKFQAAYWSPGVSGTQILYLDDNPLSDVVIGSIEGRSSAALTDVFGFKYNNWGVGFTLNIPINSFLTRADHARAQASLEQAMVGLKNKEQQIFLEIKNVVRAVQTDYKRVQAYKLARELAEKKLDAEEKKLKVGLTTNYVVLQHQRDLADAKSAELRAIIDYNLSLARLDKTLGTTLEKKNIKISEMGRLFP